MTHLLNLLAALLGVTTVFLLGFDCAWRRFRFPLRRVAPWVVAAWLTLLVTIGFLGR